ncbi:MAG: RNA polymerase factor sigma-32 [Magnetococcales bacterium]|nr:RNA polymerase factor sigma-32 [Magnetococcales bacterium]
MSTNDLAIYHPSRLADPGGDSGFGKFVRQALQAPMLSPEQEYELAVRFQKKKDLEAAHRLVFSYLRYVLKIANEYRNYQLNFSDLVQEGTLGLMQAVKKFDPDRGNRLSTYAVWWIRASIHDFILRSWRMVKIATTQLKRQLFFKLRQEKKSMAPLQLEEAEELAEKFGTNAETILEFDSRMGGADTSLNQPVLDGSGEMINLIVDQRPNQELEMADQQQQMMMNRLIGVGMKNLTSREQLIISARFLSDNQETLDSLGEKLSVSRERVRQIEKAALEKLKRFFQNSQVGRDLVMDL